MRRTKSDTKQRKTKAKRHGGAWLGRHLHTKVPKYTVVLLLISYTVLGVLAGTMILHELREGNEAEPSRVVSHNSSEITSLRVTSVRTGEKSQTPFEAPQGESFVVVDVTLYNNSSQPFYFAPVLQTYISDASGAQYKMSPAVLDKPIEAGSVEAKQSINGMLSYLVPDDATGLVLHFQPDQPNAKLLDIPL